MSDVASGPDSAGDFRRVCGRYPDGRNLRVTTRQFDAAVAAAVAVQLGFPPPRVQTRRLR